MSPSKESYSQPTQRAEQCGRKAYRDNIDLEYAGLNAATLSNDQKDLLLDVVHAYVGTMDEGHAAIKMREVEDHLDKTWFAWVGGTADDSVFYRIHSPVLLIKFDHQRRVAPFRSEKPSRDHIHAVLRTPNGNDYKDLCGSISSSITRQTSGCYVICVVCLNKQLVE